LANAFQKEDILVTTTHRLLRYLTIRDQIKYRAESRGDVLVITIDAVDDPIKGTYVPLQEELQGITFKVHGKRVVELWLVDSKTSLDGKIEYVNGKTYASVSWQPLVFPQVDLRKGL